MRRKYQGYIFQFTSSEHGGRHLHVYRDDRPLGVFDRLEGPIRGLDKAWNNALREGLEQFISDLNERGHFLG